MNQPPDLHEDADGVLDLRVEEMRREAEGVLSLTLADPDGGLLPEWAPGAHIDIEFPDITRQFSLCGDPADRSRYRIAVLREPASRGGSRYVHEALRVGDPVVVGGPRNHFALAEAERYLFVAGGIGVTPVLPMIAAAEARGAEWRLAYVGRHRGSMAFLSRLAEYGEKCEPYVTAETGRPDVAQLLAGAGEGTAVYCCGPEGLLDAVEEVCPEGADVHLERFRAPVAGQDHAEDREFLARCSRSQTEVRVPVGRRLIECLDEAGILLAHACREGICGSCRTTVLSGDIDHRDALLDPQERESGSTMLPCVSRAVSDELVLDL